MAQVGWHAQLHPDQVDEYVRMHREIWPEMVRMLQDAGVRNYSIFVDGTRVFGTYECDDPQAALEHQQAAEVTRRWDAHMAELFASDGITHMTRVMHLP